VRRFLPKICLFLAIFLVQDYVLANFLKKGIDKTYGLDHPSPLLSVGHSHTQSGIDRDLLEKGSGMPVSMYATGGATTFDRLAMIRHYFSLYPGAVHTVVYDVDFTTFNSRQVSSNSYRQFYPYLDNPDMAEYIRKNVGSWSEYTSRQLVKLLRYDNHTLNQSLRGHLNFRQNFKQGRVDVERLKESLARGKQAEIAIDEENLRCFEETVRLVRSHNARLVLLYIPTIDLMNNYDRHHYNQVISMFTQYAAHDPGILFLNYNLKYADRHELFRDPTHLNRAGQILVTNDLVRDIQN
jgi:hypothetical protein